MARSSAASTDGSSRLTAVEILDRLIAFDTVSDRSNRALIDWAADYLRGHGITPVILPDADGTKANLVARIGPAADGGVVLSGHTDVVPVVGQDWSSDPFRMSERDGRLYGRGTADMKGFVAVVLAAAPDLAARPLRRPVYIALSYDEGVGCFGVPHIIDHLIENGPTPSLAIIGEPTLMRPCNAHKGIQVFRTSVTGREAHSSSPESGVNAVRYAAALVVALGRIADRERQSPDGSGRFDPPYATLNVGRIEGGSVFNIVPPDCRFVWDLRPLPRDDPEALLAEFEAVAADDILPQIRRTAPDGGIATERLCDVPALRPDPDGPAETLARQLTGANTQGTVAFATEAGLFQRAGISAVVLGPGDIAQAHKPDEFITRDQLAAGTAFLDRLADWAEG